MVALAVAVPAHAGNGAAKARELRISGPIVKVSGTAVSVENLVGDAVLTCVVPGGSPRTLGRSRSATRCACTASATAAVGLSSSSWSGSARSRGSRSRPPRSKRRPGPIVELGDAAIVVQSSEGRLACRVPEEKQAKLEGPAAGHEVPSALAERVAGRFAVGDRVKMICRGHELVYLEKV